MIFWGVLEGWRDCAGLCVCFFLLLYLFFDGWRDQIEKSFSHRNLVISRAICSLGNCKTMPLRVNFGFKRALPVEHLRAAGCGYIVLQQLITSSGHHIYIYILHHFAIYVYPFGCHVFSPYLLTIVPIGFCKFPPGVPAPSGFPQLLDSLASATFRRCAKSAAMCRAFWAWAVSIFSD